jgi:DNA anti-recombination protein RmuC
LDKAQGQVQDIHRMLDTSLRALNTEFGFALQTPAPPDVRHRAHELDLIQRNHLQYLGLGNLLKLTQIEFTERLGKALMSRLKAVYEGASTEVEQWNKAVASQLDTQLRERRRNFTRRIEAVTRIQQAAGGLDERIAELHAQQNQLEQLLARLDQLTAPDNPELDPAVVDADNPAPWPSAPDADEGIEATDTTPTP